MGTEIACCKSTFGWQLFAKCDSWVQEAAGLKNQGWISGASRGRE